jgi:hypothetical protein
LEATYFAALPYWTLSVGEYRTQTDIVMEFKRDVKLLFAEMWVGYDAYSMFEGGMRVFLERAIQRPLYAVKTVAMPPLYLGGFYLHKHIPISMTENDYRPLKALNKLQPLAEAGSRIRIDRDCKNIGWQVFNAWDCELILIVDE